MVLDPELETELRRRAKQQIRKRMRALRGTVPQDALAERSAEVVKRVAESEAFAHATEVALFAPMLARGEVDLRALEAITRERGKAIAFPSLTNEGADMVFRRASLDSLEEKGHGFEEAPDSAPLVEPHDRLLIVVPALAIDGRGHRIGYGGGYYDRALGHFAPPAITMAVAYDFQVLADIPADEWDRSVEWVFTDTRFFRTTQGARA